MSEKQDETMVVSKTPEKKVETPQPKKTEEKLFTQNQVNDIVTGRVSKYKDYDDLKVKADQVNTFKEENDNLKNKNVKVDETLKDVCDSLISQIPDDKISLIPEDIDTLAKIKYINKNRNNLIEQTVTTPIPTTPPKNESERSEGGLIMGKYKTEMEASKNANPREFSEWCKSHPYTE